MQTTRNLLHSNEPRFGRDLLIQVLRYYQTAVWFRSKSIQPTQIPRWMMSTYRDKFSNDTHCLSNKLFSQGRVDARCRFIHFFLFVVFEWKAKKRDWKLTRAKAQFAFWANAINANQSPRRDQDTKRQRKIFSRHLQHISDSTTMASSSAAAATEHPNKLAFEEGVSYIFHNWTALKLAVEQDWGGVDSAEKREWFIDVIIEHFGKRKCGSRPVL